jgi:beta-N-acetylhexosaminidase
MLDLSGLEVTSEEKELLQHPATGGVILFSRNYESPQQINRLIESIHQIRSPAILVAVDQEGGRVQRFREGFSRLPPAAVFGALYDQNHDEALHAARRVGWLMAAELRCVGIDFSFAPVLDINAGVSEVIGDRAFHSNPDIVSRLAHAWMDGAREAGMASVGKHFPGHGGVEADSHLALPIDFRNMSEIEGHDLVTFANLIDYGLDAVMPAHVIYENVDDQLAGFSRFWLQQILRHDLKFQGVIFSDDLTMAAAEQAGSYSDRARAALEAGCDMVLVCNNRDGAIEVLDELKDYTDPVAQSRLARMHGQGHLNHEKMHLDPRWREALQIISQLVLEDSMNLDLDTNKQN